MWTRHDMANQVWCEENWVWYSLQDPSYVLDLKHENGIGRNNAINHCFPKILLQSALYWAVDE